MLILGIETSCDETAAAVVQDGTHILSNVIASQVELHARYGGIVPEVASRQHLLSIETTVSESLKKANLSIQDLDAIAVTHGPGLAGALIVGVNFAKSLAHACNIPLLGVNHLEGHIYAIELEGFNPEDNPGFPLVALIASGGHTELILFSGHGLYQLIGRTRDDAAGEAFDKAARVLGLGFPGGPAIQQAAKKGLIEILLPRPNIKSSLDFSFSGLKTALVRKAQELKVYPPSLEESSNEELIANIAAEFQDSMVEVMVNRTLEAVEFYKAKGILLGGGVAANSQLRAEMAENSKVPVLMPSPKLCTDNGAMIAAAGYRRLIQGEYSPLSLDVIPNLHLSYNN